MINSCNKTRYGTRKEAKKARKRTLISTPGLQLHIYHCNRCRGFHLTKYLYRIGNK